MTAAMSVCFGRGIVGILQKMESASVVAACRAMQVCHQSVQGMPQDGHTAWGDWRCHACAELLEKHLQLQQKQVWIECLGVTQKGIFKDTYTILPSTTTVKGKPVLLRSNGRSLSQQRAL